MNIVQGRMALAALGWSWDRLAEEADISRPTVARFLAGDTVRPEKIEAMRRAFESAGVRFLHSGQFAGAVVPPKSAPTPDMSFRNPNIPGRQG
jgi:transcriptional regulator with XRE-family HTH domain